MKKTSFISFVGWVGRGREGFKEEKMFYIGLWVVGEGLVMRGEGRVL